MVFGWVKSQRFICGRLPKQTTESDRLVLSNEPSLCLPNDRHNYISTRRYNWFTFLPLSLLFQFRKLSNCYFLFIAILVQIPGLTPVNRYSTVVPLIFVLVVSELREFLEEWNASQRDKETNETQVPLLVGATKSSNIRPGDVIKVHRDKFVPCDILILQTSNSDGSCFVETSSLDGETNLRLKRAPACTNSLPPSNLLEKCAIKVVCDAPNADMHSFSGRVELDKASEDVSLINIVWRGSTVRNTDWVIGLVIFSGDDTTILLNLKAVGLIPSKTTQMENQMNRNVLFIFLLQIILCAIAASIGSPVNQPWYLDSAQRAGWQSLFFGYFILLASLIPVSLWVSVEILKLFQSWLIEATERTRKLGGGVNCNAKNLHEELGQITHVFTDKTGTLTSNCMRFVGCCVGDKMYLDTADAAPINLKIDFQGIVAPSRELIDQVSTRNNFLLFKCLSLCHTCERITEPLTGQVTNQSLSPDEAALVSMAAECGVIFQGRPGADKISIAHDFEEELRVLYELPFTSERKMMSVVFQDREDKIFIFSKGADSVIIPKCVNETSIVVNAVDEFSRFGYRTLCCAYREIPKTEWNGIANTIARSGHVRNRIVADDSDTDGVVSPISPYSSLESNLILIGCTAVEDKLQDGVPETLRAMKAAGIKVCMITGDKRETAINIATSCGLIGSKKNVHVMLNGKKSDSIIGAGIFVPYHHLQEIAARRWHPSPTECPQAHEYWLSEARDLGLTSGSSDDLNESSDTSKLFSVVIDGKNLQNILSSKSSTDQLVKVLTFSQCEGVIFCRVSPQQKGDIVKLVKNSFLSGYSTREKTRSILAIGDGANDVNMIKIANVGVGVAGREGSQAANSADYSVKQFSDLYRLLFLHGRWNYKRTRIFISVFLYKNFSFALTQFWFGTVSQFSGQTAYDSTYLMLFNSVFGIVPLFVFGLWDMDVDPDIHPRSDEKSWTGQIVTRLYSNEARFSSGSILLWCCLGLVHSLIVFYGAWYGWGSPVSFGREASLWMTSILSYTVEVILVSLMNLWVAHSWSTLFIVSLVAFNIGLYFAFVFVYNVIPLNGNGQYVYEIAQSTMGNVSFWLAMVLLVSIAIFPLVVGGQVWKKVRPSFHQILRLKQRGKNQHTE